MRDDVKAIQKLVDDLSVAVARIKPAKIRPMVVIKFLNCQDPRYKMHALYCASDKRAYRAVRLLHDLKANLDARTTDDQGCVVAHVAAQMGDRAMVRLLHELKADLQCRVLHDGGLPIHSSAQQGHSDTTALLLELKADPNVQDNEGRTPLWVASFDGYIGVIKTLIAAGAKVNLADAQGMTPLYAASSQGQVRSISTLAELSASIDQETNKGWSPIAMAAAAHAGKDEVVRLLAHLGARLHASDGHGFWMWYKDDDKRHQATEFWTEIVQAGGDEGTDDSLRYARGFVCLRTQKCGTPDER